MARVYFALLLLNWPYLSNYVINCHEINCLDGELIRLTHQIIYVYEKWRDIFFIYFLFHIALFFGTPCTVLLVIPCKKPHVTIKLSIDINIRNILCCNSFDSLDSLMILYGWYVSTQYINWPFQSKSLLNLFIALSPLILEPLTLSYYISRLSV